MAKSAILVWIFYTHSYIRNDSRTVVAGDISGNFLLFLCCKLLHCSMTGNLLVLWISDSLQLSLFVAGGALSVVLCVVWCGTDATVLSADWLVAGSCFWCVAGWGLSLDCWVVVVSVEPVGFLWTVAEESVAWWPTGLAAVAVCCSFALSTTLKICVSLVATTDWNNASGRHRHRQPHVATRQDHCIDGAVL